MTAFANYFLKMFIIIIKYLSSHQYKTVPLNVSGTTCVS